MTIFKQLKQAFAAFIETCKALTDASREQTKAVTALQTALKGVEQHTKYLAHSERQRNEREGRGHV